MGEWPPSLVDLPEWKAAVGGKRNLYNKLALQLTSGDINPLLHMLQEGSDKQKSLALYMLYRTLIQGIPITDDEKQRLALTLRPLVRAYPERPGPDAYCLLFRIAPDEAERFLLDEFDQSKISESGFACYLWDIAKLNSPRAAERLWQYSRQDGPRGGRAKELLKLQLEMRAEAAEAKPDVELGNTASIDENACKGPSLLLKDSTTAVPAEEVLESKTSTVSVSLTEAGDKLLIDLPKLVGINIAIAFLDIFRNTACGDRVTEVLNAISKENFSNLILRQLIVDLTDPAFDGSNATVKAILGYGYFLKGASGR